MDWNKTIQDAQGALDTVERAVAALNKYRDSSTAEIAQYLRVDKGIELDIDAIKATTTRPYTLVPINEHEAWLIHWRGVKMPIFGWVVAAEPAFIKARVTRSMDLLTPLPAWMKSELGWKPPAHAAIIDGTRTGLQLTEGDEASFKRRYGQHLGAKRADGSFAIKAGDAWIKLVAALVRDGILPYAPMPVAKENWNAKAKYPDLLEKLIEKFQDKAQDDYIDRAVEEFRERGAILTNYPPGSGKTLVASAVLNHFIGHVLILGDSTMLIEQWRERLPLLAPDTKAEITISTYQGAAKYLDKDWDLIVPDEAQRLPANTFSKLAFVKTKYRLGLTGTAWREDDRQHLIVALSGFPVAIRWASLVNAGVLRRPRIIVATVPSEQAKTNYVKHLVAKRKGRTLIFCDWIEQGQALADALDVPFVHGSSARKLQTLQENEICVVSRVADRGISLSDIRLAIEVAGQGSAREQFAQRVGRLLHGEFEGEFITVFTPEEAAKYRGRIFGVEAELAGEVDIEFITVGNVPAEEKSYTPKKIRSSQRSAPSGDRALPQPRPAKPEKPRDEIDEILQLPAVAAKVQNAKKTLGSDAVGYVDRVIRLCWNAPFSPTEIAEGLGTGYKSENRISRAIRACVQIGFMVQDGDRFKVNKPELERLKALSALRRK